MPESPSRMQSLNQNDRQLAPGTKQARCKFKCRARLIWAHLNGRSSTGVTLALPRNSGAKAAAQARQAARFTHTSASTASSACADSVEEMETPAQ